MTLGHPENVASGIRILLVEDDREILDLLEHYLQRRGYDVTIALDRHGVAQALATQTIGIVLLDLMLPTDDGRDLCRFIKTREDVPVIMISALADVQARIAGLSLGADDYLGKPFNLQELEARITAVLRRSGSSSQSTEYRFGNWIFSPLRRALYSRRRVRVILTAAETELLRVLCQHPHELLTRPRIINQLRGAPDAIDERTIDLTISRLRRKLASEGHQLTLIRTVRGDGYIFDPEAGTEKGVSP